MLMYDVGGKILNAINSMYEESTVCVRIGRGLCKKFRVDVGLTTGLCDVTMGVKHLY
jgi:hypothetical protein